MILFQINIKQTDLIIVSKSTKTFKYQTQNKMHFLRQ